MEEERDKETPQEEPHASRELSTIAPSQLSDAQYTEQLDGNNEATEKSPSTQKREKEGNATEQTQISLQNVHDTALSFSDTAEHVSSVQTAEVNVNAATSEEGGVAEKSTESPADRDEHNDTTETTETIEAKKSTEAKEIIETKKSVETTDAIDTKKLAEAIEDVHTTKSAEAVESVNATKSAEIADDVETTEATKPSEPSKNETEESDLDDDGWGFSMEDLDSAIEGFDADLNSVLMGANLTLSSGTRKNHGAHQGGESSKYDAFYNEGASSTFDLDDDSEEPENIRAPANAFLVQGDAESGHDAEVDDAEVVPKDYLPVLVPLFMTLEFGHAKSPAAVVSSAGVKWRKTPENASLVGALLQRLAEETQQSPVAQIRESIAQNFEVVRTVTTQCTTCGEVAQKDVRSYTIAINGRQYPPAQNEVLHERCGRCGCEEKIVTYTFKKLPQFVVFSFPAAVRMKIGEALTLSRAPATEQLQRQQQRQEPRRGMSRRAQGGGSEPGNDVVYYFDAAVVADGSTTPRSYTPLFASSPLLSTPQMVRFVVYRQRVPPSAAALQNDLQSEYLHHPLWKTLTAAIRKQNEAADAQSSEAEAAERKRTMDVVNQVVLKEGVLDSLTVPPVSADYYWISRDWLELWASTLPEAFSPHARGGAAPLAVPPIDNSAVVCSHGGVTPGRKSIRKVTRISRGAWEYFAETYGGGPALGKGRECLQCLRVWAQRSAERATFMARKNRIYDQVVNADLWASNSRSFNQRYIVSKSFVRAWQRMTRPPPVPFERDALVKDLLCEHGKLSVDKSKRTVVTELGLRYLVSLCGGKAASFEESAPPCAVCAKAAEERERKKEYEKKAVEGSVVRSKKQIAADTTYYLLGAAWLARWREYIAGKLASPGPLACGELFCQHSLIAFDVIGSLASKISVLKASTYPCEFVNERLFAALTKKHGVAPPVIKVRVNKFSPSLLSQNVQPYQIDALVVPGVCSVCEAKWQKKWSKPVTLSSLLASAWSALKPEGGDDGEDDDGEDDDGEDVILRQLRERQRAEREERERARERESEEDDSVLSYKAAPISVVLPDGKSISLTVDSTTMVWELKELIAKALGEEYAPEHQIVQTMYAVLTRSYEPLSSYGITPGATLLLKLRGSDRGIGGDAEAARSTGVQPTLDDEWSG